MRRKGYGDSHRWATLCSSCGEIGWDDVRRARGELNRVRQRLRRLALGVASPTARSIHRCDSGLWHVTAPTTSTPRHRVLVLPSPPRHAPGIDSSGRASYLAEVAALVLGAIRDQGAGLALPKLSEICDHYRTSRRWTWRLRLALAELGWLRHVGDVYVTCSPGSDTTTGEGR